MATLMDDCSLSPHCPVCEALGKPADHIVGSRSCDANKAPPKKRVPVSVPVPDKEGVMETDVN